MVRPRSTQAHEKVLDAALRLFGERGIEATSMDAIADASGVSKATIYNHWPDKDALCLEVMSRLHRPGTEAEVDSGDLRADLVTVLTQRPSPEHEDLRARLMPHLMAYAASRPAFGKAWRARVLEPPRVQIARLLERGIAEGRLPRSTDPELAMALLLGPMLYGHILTMIDRPQPKELARAAVDAFLQEHSTRSRINRARAELFRRLSTSDALTSKRNRS
jgi:AcrR family transcriptional regulator